jgi:hypothetical protein
MGISKECVSMDDADYVLEQRYELVVLEQAPDHRLELSTISLFHPGASQGARRPFRVRCTPGPGESGTAFVVVTCPRPQDYQILSIQAIKLPPGTYDVTARLVASGEVRFSGPSGRWREDPRSWREIVATIPYQLDQPAQTHLIVAIEASGDPDLVLERIDRAAQLIRRAVERSGEELRVSLLSYGPHRVHREDFDQSPKVLSWARTGDDALAELTLLTEQPCPPLGYWRAAQLECLLTMLTTRIKPSEGRPILVTIGSRPAFPPQVDPRSEIIPCPKRHDWRTAWETLSRHADIAFGAIRDEGGDEGVWSFLGRSASAYLNTADLHRFTTDLGLSTDKVSPIGLPLAVLEES